MTADRALLGPVTVLRGDVVIALDGAVWIVAGDAMYRAREITLTPDEADGLAQGLQLAAQIARRH